MAKKAKQDLGVETLEAVADTGYFNGQQIKACIEAGITPYVPEPDKKTSGRKQGRFCREVFHYDDELEGYVCPAGKLLKRTGKINKNGKHLLRYASKASVCAQCPQKDVCLPAKTPYRQIYRWEHEHIVEEHRERMNQAGNEKMRQRAALAEHPFGTLKQLCGGSHFLLCGKDKVNTEMALMMLGYNLKRVLNILGLETFRTYCLQRAKNCDDDIKKAQLDHMMDANTSIFLIFRLFFNNLNSDNIQFNLNDANVVFF